MGWDSRLAISTLAQVKIEKKRKTWPNPFARMYLYPILERMMGMISIIIIFCTLSSGENDVTND